MWKWLFRLVVLGVIGSAGYAAYDLHRAGYFTMPELEEDQYWMSLKNGFRLIVTDEDVAMPSVANDPKFVRTLNRANPDRRYLGIPLEGAYWLEDAWSICRAPSPEEQSGIQNNIPEDWQTTLSNARLERLCEVDVDGEMLPRGLLFSVPRL